jgi:hypothetical protein
MRVQDLKATGKKPRVHGNGFIQLDLNDEGTRRLHVWDESIPRQTVATPVHDHVFALKSRVIAGTLIHEVLEPIEGDTHRIFRAQQEEGTQNTILVPDEGTVALKVAERFVLPAGVEYEFPAWELHQTDHRGLTATIMEKIDAPQEYGRPRVLVPTGQEPDNEFKRDGIDPETLWPLIERALELARAMEEVL